MPSSHQHTFLASLIRCKAKDEFTQRFYERFLASGDVIASKFLHTDFDSLTHKLVRSLELIADATAGRPEGLAELRDRARMHDRKHYDVRPEMYAIWQGAILETATEFDEWWCEEVEEAWRAILGYVIGYMSARYE